MANISFNPSLATSPQNTFLLDTQGLIQGMTMDDPVSRMHLKAGIIASSVTQPVWGGLAVTAQTNGLADGNSLNVLSVPGTGGTVQGFTVFDQSINLIQIPGNSVPTVVAGNNIGFYLIGSKARVPVPIDSGTVADFENVNVDTPLFWDTATNALTTVSGGATIALTGVLVDSVHSNSKTVSYNSTTGAVTWLYGQYAAVIIL